MIVAVTLKCIALLLRWRRRHRAEGAEEDDAVAVKIEAAAIVMLETAATMTLKAATTLALV